MLEILAGAGEAGESILDSLGRDDLVASLLLLYGLHPLDFETRVQRRREGPAHAALAMAATRSWRSNRQAAPCGFAACTASDSGFTADAPLKAAVEEAIYRPRRTLARW